VSRSDPSARRTITAPLLAAILTVALLAAACSGDEPAAPAPTAPPPPAATPVSATDQAAIDALGVGGRCDELDAARCLLPFPSFRFTTPDPTTPTGVRVELPEGQLTNVGGAALQVEPWRSLDGFSPGTPMLTLLGDVDLRRHRPVARARVGDSRRGPDHG